MGNLLIDIPGIVGRMKIHVHVSRSTVWKSDVLFLFDFRAGYMYVLGNLHIHVQCTCMSGLVACQAGPHTCTYMYMYLLVNYVM